MDDTTPAERAAEAAAIQEPVVVDGCTLPASVGQALRALTGTYFGDTIGDVLRFAIQDWVIGHMEVIGHAMHHRHIERQEEMRRQVHAAQIMGQAEPGKSH